MLLKFGQKEHLEQMLEEGLLYMNSVQYFRDYEEQGLRGDKNEGATKLISYPKGSDFKMEIIETGETMDINPSSLSIWENTEIVYGNIFSLTNIRPTDFTETSKNTLRLNLDKKLKDFGDYCLMIFNSPTFLKMYDEAIEREGLKGYFGDVKYYDRLKMKQIETELDLFQKDHSFEYQKEFRFYLHRKSKKPYALKLGALKEVARLLKTDDIEKLEVKFKNNG